MTPEDVLTVVENYLPTAANSTLCHIEKSCNPVRGCAHGSSYSVIDFDMVKDMLCRNIPQHDTLSSVDALTANQKKDTLLLVELKSWKKVIKHPVTGAIAQDEVLEKTAEKYISKLAKKITDSFTLLQNLTGRPMPADGLEWAVVFVSDLDTDPLSQISTNLNSLAAFPTAVTERCNELTNLALDQLPAVNTYYTGCHEFDRNILLY